MGVLYGVSLMGKVCCDLYSIAKLVGNVVVAGTDGERGVCLKGKVFLKQWCCLVQTVCLGFMFHQRCSYCHLLSV